MAIKLTANYAKRLGLPGYSSHQFSVSVETELREVGDAAQESARLYRELQASVDEQIQKTGFVPPQTYGMEERPRQPEADDASGWGCSEKQRDFLLRLLEERRIDKWKIENLSKERFGVPVKTLNRMQMSNLLDELIEEHGGKRQGRERERLPFGQARREGGGKMSVATLAPAVEPAENKVADDAATIAELVKSVSASRLNCWLECRLKFRFRYIDRITKPPAPALFYGQMVHGALRRWNLARWKGETLTPEDLKAFLMDTWEQAQNGLQPGISWDGKSEEQRANAWKLLEIYLAETPIPAGEKPEAVEVAIEADLSKHGLPTVVGVLDLVRPPGLIVDFKTAKSTPTSDKAAHQNGVQLAIYGLLYRLNTGAAETGFELHHMVKLKEPKVLITRLEPLAKGRVVGLFRLFESYVKGLDRGDFVPAPGLHCVACEYFGECRRWMEGGRIGNEPLHPADHPSRLPPGMPGLAPRRSHETPRGEV